eukprot:1721822-Rhodomonas_salina.1
MSTVLHSLKVTVRSAMLITEPSEVLLENTSRASSRRAWMSALTLSSLASLAPTPPPRDTASTAAGRHRLTPRS